MKRSGPPKRRTPLRATSAKRRRQNVDRRRVLHERYGPNPPCYACAVYRKAGIETGCDGRATDGHELLSRARGGSIIDTGNVVPVGRACHMRITSEPAEAERLGLARSAFG